MAQGGCNIAPLVVGNLGHTCCARGTHDVKDNTLLMFLFRREHCQIIVPKNGHVHRGWIVIVPTVHTREIALPMHPVKPLTVLVGCLLTACAAATPGYIPPAEKPKLTDKVKAFQSGDVAATGLYEPSAAERALDCRRLTGSMHIMIARIKDAPNRPTPSPTTKTLERATISVTGRPERLDLSAEQTREAGRLVAYNKLLAEKKCPMLDLAAQGLPELAKR